MSEDDNPFDVISSARKLWLQATTKAELEQVERLYMQALTSKANEGDADGPPKKKRKLSREEYRQASEKLALLLCQSGRCKKAKKPLAKLGFTCRLAEHVLDYPSDGHRATPKNNSGKIAPCQIVDGFLSKEELHRLRSVLQSPSANYWAIHKYRVEPPSPYFSYVIPLADVRNDQSETNRFGFIGDLIEKILSCPMLSKKFPDLSQTQFIEMWAHNRPHASGHQMHFDSDDEGRGGIRNPIISTILYITADDNESNNVNSCTGGPSLVTNQTLDSDYLATRGWLAHPKPRRLVAFDGRYLHGVIPGKGTSSKNSRRVTLMFAFWKELKVRRGLGPGSARPFPVKNMIPEWAKELTAQSEQHITGASQSQYQTCEETTPIELDVVYETLDGKAWKKSKGMPSYDEVFQGF